MSLTKIHLMAREAQAATAPDLTLVPLLVGPPLTLDDLLNDDTWVEHWLKVSERGGAPQTVGLDSRRC